METKITKEKFDAFEKVRIGGKTNMFDIKMVITLSKNKLTKADCLNIMSNYDKYEVEFAK